jgi:hypothetical protein
VLPPSRPGTDGRPLQVLRLSKTNHAFDLHLLGPGCQAEQVVIAR